MRQETTAKISIPSVDDLYRQVPEEVWKQRREDADAPLWAEFCCAYLRMLSFAMSFFARAEGQPRLTVTDFRHASWSEEERSDPLKGQWILEIYVYDSGAPQSNGMNLHGQSMNQCMFGCGICIEGGKVSTHT